MREAGSALGVPGADDWIVQCVQTKQALHALEPEWTNLHAADRESSIFMSWDWMSSWWDIYGDDTKELMVVTVRTSAGQLVCLAPLIRNRLLWKKVIPVRQIRFMGTGEPEEDEVCSEYLDFLLDTDYPADTLIGSVLDFLETQPQWGEIWFEQLASGSRLARHLAANRHYQPVDIGKSYYLSLPARWEDLLERLSSNQRYRVRKTLKELQKLGALELRVATTEDEVHRLFDQLVALHEANWRRKGRTGVFASTPFRTFHESLIRHLLLKDQLFLAQLELDGVAIGSVYCLRHNNRLLVYQTGFDTTVSQHNNKIKPGMATHATMIQAAIELGIVEYDFMAGDLNEYKSQWTSTSRAVLGFRRRKKGIVSTIYSVAGVLRGETGPRVDLSLVDDAASRERSS